MEVNFRKVGIDIWHQCRTVLLEARAMEYMVVARRKPKRKRVCAGNEAHPVKVGLVTIL